MTERFQIGAITQTHGIRGEVKVFPMTDEVSRFKKLKEVILDDGKKEQILHVESVKFFKQFVILKFKEFSNINEIEMYKGAGLYVNRKDAVKLKKDEYFIADLIGLHVSTEDGMDLGTLTDVLQTGANDVYVVEKEKKEVLIPAIHDCIKEVDVETGNMIVHLLDGLLEE